MNKNKSKEELLQAKGDELLTISELETLTGLRLSTLKYYLKEQLIPYEHGGDGLHYRFRKDTATKRLNEIVRLKETKRLTIEELKEHFNVK